MTIRHFFLFLLLIACLHTQTKVWGQYISPEASIAADLDQKMVRLKPYKKVIVQNCNCNVYLTATDSFYAIVDAEPDDMKQVRVINKGKKIVIKYRNSNKVGRPQDINVNLYGKEFLDIQVRDNSQLKCQDKLQEAQMKISSTAEGSVDLTVENSRTKVYLGGKGSITLHGSTTKLKAKHRGLGHLNARDLKAIKVSASIKNRGHCSVHAERIVAFVASNASLYFVGNPKILTLVQKGGSLIHQTTEEK